MRLRYLNVVIVAMSTVASLACAQEPKPKPASESSTVSSSDSDLWWKHAVIYEIYPRSFADSNGDGIGDLNGITRHLDYLRHLGIDAIWLTPMYPSPQVDFGYDIAGYEAVDPMYGTIANFDGLQAEAHKLGIRIILDMVLNHTSDHHPWFLESARSRDNPKADWYVWNSGVPANAPDATAYQKRFEHEGMVPPNNWTSSFGGSAWEWVPARKQFYYHFFYKQQPDLNWRNPAVERAMFSVMRFWLDKGVSGFRLDAIPMLFEDPALRDDGNRGGVNAQGDPNLDHRNTYNLPEVHDVLRRLRTMVDGYPGNRVLIGETYVFKTVDLDKWYGGAAQDELQLPMDTLLGYGLTFLGQPPTLSARYFRKYIDEAFTQLHGSQPLFVFDNHDNPRSIDRFGDGVHNTQIAKLIATILYTTPATAMTYYGAEIGMVTSTPTRIEEVRDPMGISGWPKEKGRDGERTPMQWTPGAQAGFSTNPKTWLPVAPDFETVNVQTESKESGSLLNWSKTLIELRRSDPALRGGSITMLDKDNPNVLSFVRKPGGAAKPVIVMLNMTSETSAVSLDLSAAGVSASSLQVLATTDPHLSGTSSLSGLKLPPFSAIIASVR